MAAAEREGAERAEAEIERLRAALAEAERKIGHHNEVANTALRAWDVMKAERAEILRIVSAWCVEANNQGGIDAGDLAWRLEQAGHPLPEE